MEIRGPKKRENMTATSLQGMRVVNPGGEDLGRIEDLMINLNTGCLAYAALSVKGVLGLGEKLFAVPLEALVVDQERMMMVLDVSRQRLKSEPGFKRDAWPDSADPLWGEPGRMAG